MATPDYDGVFLLLANLQKSRERKVHHILGTGNMKDATCINRLNSIVLHWAVQVRDLCYEVTSKDYNDTPQRHEFEMRVSSWSQWENRRQRHDLLFRKIKVGASRYSDEDILREARRIWISRFRTIYDISRQNCQNFSYLLLHNIKIGQSDRSIPFAELDSWKPIPARLTQIKTMVKKIGPWILAGAALEAVESNYPTLLANGSTKRNLAMIGVLGGVLAAVITPVVRAKGRDRKWLKQCDTTDVPLNYESQDMSLSLVNLQRKDIEVGNEHSDQQAQEIHDALLEDTKLYRNAAEYQGYNQQMINEFVLAGYEPREVVNALQYWGISTFEGKYFSFDENDMATMLSTLQERRSEQGSLIALKYAGYNRDMIDLYVEMGFEVEEVVKGFRSWGLETYDGRFYEFNEEDTRTMIDTLIGQA